MAFSGVFTIRVLFRGILVDDVDEIDFWDLDTRASNLYDELNLIQPNRKPDLRLDYMGISGEVEFLYFFKSLWDERSSDINDYLDNVQQVIEDNLSVLINEVEFLGSAIE